MHVGAAQISSLVGDLQGCLDKHLEWIQKGREAKLDLLVFPEVSLTGHYGSDYTLEMAMSRKDPRLAKLATAAGDMLVLLGFIEEGPGAQYHNSAALLQNGRVVHLHRKINLPNYGKLEEGKHYASGRFVEVYDHNPNWQLGTLVCADAWNPALTHLTFLHGATLLMCPISSGVEAVGADFDNPSGWATAMKFYSMMYGAPSIMVNRVGAEKDLNFWGGSRIVDPFGNVLAQAYDEETLITGELNYDEVRRARYQLPTVRDSNLSLVLRESNRLEGKLGVPGLIRDD